MGMRHVHVLTLLVLLSLPAQPSRGIPAELSWLPVSGPSFSEPSPPGNGEMVQLFDGALAAGRWLVWPVQRKTPTGAVTGLRLRSLDPDGRTYFLSLPTAARGLAWESSTRRLFVRTNKSLVVFAEGGQRAEYEVALPTAGSWTDMGFWQGRLFTLAANRLTFFDPQTGKTLSQSAELPLPRTQRAFVCGGDFFLWSSYSGANLLPYLSVDNRLLEKRPVALPNRSLFKVTCLGEEPAVFDPLTGTYAQLVAFGGRFVPRSTQLQSRKNGGALRSAPMDQELAFELRVTPQQRGKGAVAIVLLPPARTATQEIESEQFPTGAEIRRDRDGNRALFLPISHLEPGQEHRIGVYRAKIRRYRIDIDLAHFRTPLSNWGAPSELRVHTQDLPQLLIGDPEIRQTRERLRARATTLEDYAREAFLEVRRRMRYHSDGRFDPAPVVLKQGHGTCTEFTYVTMALLRSAGIPTRMAWNYLGNGQPDFNHKLAEFWHPQLGWLPIEPLAPPATGPGTTHARHIIWAQLRTPFQEWIGTRDRLATVRGISARVQLKVTVAGTGASAPKTRVSTRGSAPGKNTARETKDGPRVE